MDFDNNQRVPLADVVSFSPAFRAHAPNPPYDVCYDLNADGAINVTDRTIDALYIKQTGGLPCTP